MRLSEKQRIEVRKAAFLAIASVIKDDNEPFKHRHLPEVPDSLLKEADDYFFKCVSEAAVHLTVAATSEGYDPVKDEKKEFTLDEFASIAMAEIGLYAEVWRGVNKFHLAKHTWDEWFHSFRGYMSW